MNRDASVDPYAPPVADVNAGMAAGFGAAAPLAERSTRLLACLGLIWRRNAHADLRLAALTKWSAVFHESSAFGAGVFHSSTVAATATPAQVLAYTLSLFSSPLIRTLR